MDIVKEIEERLNELKLKSEEGSCKTILESRYDHLAGYIACAYHAQIINQESFHTYTRTGFEYVYGKGSYDKYD